MTFKDLSYLCGSPDSFTRFPYKPLLIPNPVICDMSYYKPFFLHCWFSITLFMWYRYMQTSLRCLCTIFKHLLFYQFTWHRLPLYKVLLNSVSIVDTASPISVLITSLLKYILTVHALLSYSIDILIRIYCHYLVLWIWNEPFGFNRVRMSLVVRSQGSTDGESKGRQQWDFPETIWSFIFLFWN